MDFTPNLPHWNINKPKILFDLNTGTKTETSPIIMKCTDQEHIYTNGSKDEMK